MISRTSYPSVIDFDIATPHKPTVSNNWRTLAQSAETYPVSLGHLFNTYWMLASAPYAISGGLTNEASYFSPNISFAMSNFVDVYRDLDQARV